MKIIRWVLYFIAVSIALFLLIQSHIMEVELEKRHAHLKNITSSTSIDSLYELIKVQDDSILVLTSKLENLINSK